MYFLPPVREDLCCLVGSIYARLGQDIRCLLDRFRPGCARGSVSVNSLRAKRLAIPMSQSTICAMIFTQCCCNRFRDVMSMIASSRKGDSWPKMAVAFVQFLCRRLNLFQVEQLSLLTVMINRRTLPLRYQVGRRGMIFRQMRESFKSI